jgi:hypothetical protein
MLSVLGAGTAFTKYSKGANLSPEQRHDARSQGAVVIGLRRH